MVHHPVLPVDPGLAVQLAAFGARAVDPNLRGDWNSGRIEKVKANSVGIDRSDSSDALGGGVDDKHADLGPTCRCHVYPSSGPRRALKRQLALLSAL